MQEFSLFDTKTHFSSIISQVIENQEEILIKKRGQIVAKIVPYHPTQKDIHSTLKAMDSLAKEVSKVTKLTQKEIRKMREEGRS